MSAVRTLVANESEAFTQFQQEHFDLLYEPVLQFQFKNWFGDSKESEVIGAMEHLVGNMASHIDASAFYNCYGL
jgi:hypothetical protein